MTDDATAALLVPAVNVALDTAAVTATATIPLGGLGIAAFIELAVKPVFNATIASRPVLARLGRRRSGRCDWKGRSPAISSRGSTARCRRPDGGRSRRAGGGPHYLMTSGTRADSDSESFKTASIEVVFDATTTDYLDFLDEILPVAPKFKQAGYVSLRPSLRSQRAALDAHVRGSHAMSIEIASLQGLPGNASWLAFVHDRAVARGGRPHWGQYNKLDALDVALLYGSAIDEWREGLLTLSGTSTRFSNAFTQARGARAGLDRARSDCDRPKTAAGSRISATRAQPGRRSAGARRSARSNRAPSSTSSGARRESSRSTSSAGATCGPRLTRRRRTTSTSCPTAEAAKRPRGSGVERRPRPPGDGLLVAPREVDPTVGPSPHVVACHE